MRANGEHVSDSSSSDDDKQKHGAADAKNDDDDEVNNNVNFLKGVFVRLVSTRRLCVVHNDRARKQRQL